jgi:amphiphysin
LTLQERSELKRTQSDAQPFEQQPATSSYHHQEQAYQQPVYQQQPSYQQPAYQQQPITNNNTNTASYSNNYSTTNRAPPVPPPSRKPNNIHYVLALYDYDAQAEGDLSFKKDDKIELIERTADENDWWTGKLNGMTGIFPGRFILYS